MKPMYRIGLLLGRIPPKWQFVAFLTITLVISLALTVISYSLYVVSGTAQLDLSRPGYKQALSEVAPTNTNDFTFSSNGPLNPQVISDFKEQFNQLVGKTNNYSAFDPAAMSDDQLNIFGTAGQDNTDGGNDPNAAPSTAPVNQ